MDQLFSPEFLNQHLVFVTANAGIIVGLITLSMAIGWWLRGAAVKNEIAHLERINEVLDQRVTQRQENEAAFSLVIASLQADLAEMKARSEKLDGRMPNASEVNNLRLSAQTSTNTLGHLSAAVTEMRQMLGKYGAAKDKCPAPQ